MVSNAYPDQWAGLLSNTGHWQGSFTRIDPDGTLIEDFPSAVILEPIEDGQAVRQTNRYYEPGTGALRDEKVFSIRSLPRHVLFFENGAFSQGSLQLSPFAEFGAELGLIAGDRRLRVVAQFDPEHCFTRLTLIRERLVGSTALESAPLGVDALVGIWEGEAITLKPDGFTNERYTTRLELVRTGDTLTQHLSAGDFDFTSTARIQRSTLYFGDGDCPVRVMLLAGGASCTLPSLAPTGRPFFLEAGWLVEPGYRQRLIRNYNASGEWSSLTLVSERKATH